MVSIVRATQGKVRRTQRAAPGLGSRVAQTRARKIRPRNVPGTANDQRESKVEYSDEFRGDDPRSAFPGADYPAHGGRMAELRFGHPVQRSKQSWLDECVSALGLHP